MMQLGARDQTKGTVIAMTKGQATGHGHIDVGHGVMVAT